MSLRLFFQKRDIDIGLVKVTVQECIDDLLKLKDKTVVGKYSEMLSQDLTNGSFKGHHDVTKNAQHFNSSKDKFLDKMIQGLKDRFLDMETMKEWNKCKTIVVSQQVPFPLSGEL